jgi:hypothetical protein
MNPQPVLNTSSTAYIKIAAQVQGAESDDKDIVDCNELEYSDDELSEVDGDEEDEDSESSSPEKTMRLHTKTTRADGLLL